MNSTAHHRVRLRIRAGMDVWDAYQERYLGSVVRVWRGPVPVTPGARRAEQEDTVQGRPLVHEEGNVEEHAASQGQRQNGEEMGPFPTVSAGNRGPLTQSAGEDYATGQSDDRTNVISFAVRPGRINLGILTRPFYVPSTAVQSISMERVVLDLAGSDIPEAWRHKPRS